MTEKDLTEQLLEIKSNLESSTETDALYFYGRLGPLCYKDGLLDDIVTKSLYQFILKEYDEKFNIISSYPMKVLSDRIRRIRLLEDSNREGTLKIIDELMEIYYDVESLISEEDKEQFKAELLISSLSKGIIIKFK